MGVIYSVLGLFLRNGGIFALRVSIWGLFMPFSGYFCVMGVFLPLEFNNGCFPLRFGTLVCNSLRLFTRPI